MNKFDAARDRLLIDCGTHFHCSGHLTAVPVSQQSPDSRYCRDCYNLLLDEWAALTGHSKKPDWVPVTSAKMPSSASVAACNEVSKGINILPVQNPIGEDVTDNIECLVCGKPVSGRRADRKYCSPRCRQMACRGQRLVFAG